MISILPPVLLLFLFGSAVQVWSRPVVIVDPGAVRVNYFFGWGTSLCWWANVVGGYSNREDYAALAFSSLKLNIVRYNIGGGENPGILNTLQPRARMPGFEPAKGVWNWDADANQRWMLQRAVALGADRVVAFANSPPWWMTVSGSVTGSRDGMENNLQTGREKDFAIYLATVISNLTVWDGIHFDYVTPVNEPLSAWWKFGNRQEGCHVSPGQQARLVDQLRAALAAQNLTTGIDASEDNDEQGTLHSLAAYGSALTNVSLIATHTYHANDPTGLRRLAGRLHRPLWVSEYGDGDASGLTMARRIHDDLTDAPVSAWIYWQFVDSARGWGMLRNPLTGNERTNYVINKKFYVLGQFSQFIRPGFQILEAGDDHSLVAYNPTNQTLVIVAVNDQAEKLKVSYNLEKFAALPGSVSFICRTSPSENQAALTAINLTSRSFAATLTPKSVTTFVLNNVIASSAQTMAETLAAVPSSFNNPVYTGNLADSYCWYYDGMFYAIGTGHGEGPRDETILAPADNTLTSAS